MVNFLFNVGNDPSMIRVHELTLKAADANRYRLKGEAILTANYSRQPSSAPAKPAAVAPKALPVPNASPKPKAAPAAQSARKNL